MDEDITKEIIFTVAKINIYFYFILIIVYLILYKKSGDNLAKSSNYEFSKNSSLLYLSFKKCLFVFF